MADKKKRPSYLAPPLLLTWDQYAIIQMACARLRIAEGAALSEGRCVELIAADYLAGPMQEGKTDARKGGRGSQADTGPT